MNGLLPDIYARSIFDINYDHLKEKGIKCLLFDLDNTIAPVNAKSPSKDVIELFKKLENYEFKIIIISNATKRRIRPFKEILNVDSAALSCKPLKMKYQKIIKLYKYETFEIAAIGDQLFTDIKGANQMNITSILVNPLSPKESLITKINRLKESIVYKKWAQEKFLIKGEYYE